MSYVQGQLFDTGRVDMDWQIARYDDEVRRLKAEINLLEAVIAVMRLERER